MNIGEDIFGPEYAPIANAKGLVLALHHTPDEIERLSELSRTSLRLAGFEVDFLDEVTIIERTADAEPDGSPGFSPEIAIGRLKTLHIAQTYHDHGWAQDYKTSEELLNDFMTKVNGRLHELSWGNRSSLPKAVTLGRVWFPHITTGLVAADRLYLHKLSDQDSLHLERAEVVGGYLVRLLKL